MVPYQADSLVLGSAHRVLVRGTSFRVTSARPVQGGWLVGLEGVTTPEEAARLAGGEVEIPRSDLPALQPGEYYAADLIGLQAVDGDGNSLGVVMAVSNFGAGDILVVGEASGAERWIPLLDGVLREVLLDSGRVVVAPPQDG